MKEKLKVKPLYNYVLTLPDKPVEKVGKIYVAQQAQEMSYTATVIAVGEGKLDKEGKLIPMKIKSGDRILHKSYGLTGVKIDGKEHFILEDINILGILEEEDNA